MNIDTDSLVIFIIIWGMPIFIVVKSYLKMNTDDKKSVFNDFMSWRFIFTIGFTIIGCFFIHLGNLLAIDIIKLIGIVLFILGGIISILDVWKKSKVKSMLLLVLMSVVIFFNVN